MRRGAIASIRASRVSEKAAFRPPFSSDFYFPLLSFLPSPPLPIDDVPAARSLTDINPTPPPPPPISLYPFYLCSPDFPHGITLRHWDYSRTPRPLPRFGPYACQSSRELISFFFSSAVRATEAPLPYVLSLFLLVDVSFRFLFYFIFFYFYPFSPLQRVLLQCAASVASRSTARRTTDSCTIDVTAPGTAFPRSCELRLPAPRFDPFGKSSICLVDEKQTSAARTRLSRVRRG